MNKQMLTLSATYTEEMIESITKYMNSPFMIRLNSNDRAALFGVRHYYRAIEGESTHNTFWKKTELLLDIFSALDFQQCMVFSNYQSIAQDLCDVLESRGWSSAFISGNLEQQQRIDIYNKLKNFQCRVLITTDLSARGIDAENVNLIINLELPWEFETYLHRMGRAGRYGSYGVVINIITREEMSLMNNIIDKCHIDMQLLPNNIPCDLLENRVGIDSIDNITVQKLEKNETSNDIYSLYRIFEKYKCDSENDCLLKGQITTGTEERDGTFDPREIFHSYQNTNTNDFKITALKSSSEAIFSEDLFEIIKRTVYKQSETRNDPSPTGPTGETITDKHLDESDEDISKLEEELNRLSQWASYYSQKYQLCSDTIFDKNCELNKLLSH